MIEELEILVNNQKTVRTSKLAPFVSNLKKEIESYRNRINTSSKKLNKMNAAKQKLTRKAGDYDELLAKHKRTVDNYNELMTRYIRLKEEAKNQSKLIHVLKEDLK